MTLLVAGIASLATTTGQSADQEIKDRLSFSGAERALVRHVRVDVVAGSAAATVSAEVPMDTGAVADGKAPVLLAIVRDSDGVSVGQDLEPTAGTHGYVAGWFRAIESCPKGQACSEAFTLTFERVPEDTRSSLEFGWSVRATATGVGGPPPLDTDLHVQISP